MPFLLLVALMLLAGLARGSQSCNPSLELCMTDNNGALAPAPGYQTDDVDVNEIPDECGIPGGNGQSCRGCDGRLYPDHPEQAPQLDHCGVCGGDGTTCCGLGMCSRHGMCVESQCQCRKGWVGALCETPAVLCEEVTCGEQQGRGACVPQTGECRCVAGFTGSACQLRDCYPHGAYDRHSDSCTCAPGWAGETCKKCAIAPAHYINVCTRVGVLRKMEKREAEASLRLGLAWLPDSIVGDYYYDCECDPYDKGNVPSRTHEARALTNQQLQDALNEMLVTQINRFVTTEDELNKAVKKTKQAQEAAVTNVQKGVTFAVIVAAGSVFVTTIIGYWILNRTFRKAGVRIPSGPPGDKSA